MVCREENRRLSLPIRFNAAGFSWRSLPLSGQMPPLGEITEKTEEDSRSNRRPIELMGSSYLNLIAQPAERRWSWWGRVIFYVADVDALYDRALVAGFQPATVPRDAEWGERFFHLIDPDGHELSFARPLRAVSVP